jgi:hypothetical protein
MSLEIDIDPHGYKRTPFTEMRTRLLAIGSSFTDRELRLLPYNDLVLTAIANAGKAACSLEDVLREKERRRYRFMNLSPDEFTKAKRYLQVEGMYSDMMARARMRYAPHWDDLSPRVRLWCKLNCLYTHCDNPDARIRDTYPILHRCDEDGLLRPGFAEKLVTDLDHLRCLSIDTLDGDEFRRITGAAAEDLVTQLDSDEKQICEKDIVLGYSCTGNCYHASGE